MADSNTDEVKGQFMFCTLCRFNHDQGRKHIYSRKHKALLGKTLMKFGKKVDEARKFLKKPSVEDGELEPGSRFWCHFCTENVNKHVTDRDVTIKYGGVFEHFASESHRKNLHQYWWENGADKNLKSKFLVDKERFSSYKEEVDKKLKEFETQMEEKRRKVAAVMIGESQKIDDEILELKCEEISQIKHKEALQAHTSQQENLKLRPCRIDREIARSIQQGRRLRFSRKDRTFEPPEIQVMPEVVYKTVQNEQGILQNPTGWHEGQRVWGGGIVKYRPGSTQWFPWIMDSIDDASKSSTSSNDVMPTQFQTAEAFGDNLTCIGLPELKKGEGNVHTGATPPWLRDDDDDDDSQKSSPACNDVIGPSYDAFKKHVERMKKVNANKKNPHRVGANFDRKKETSDDWLPSFGSVWNHGPRWQSRHDFRGENKKAKKK